MLALVYIFGWLVMGFLAVTLLAFLGRHPDWDVFTEIVEDAWGLVIFAWPLFVVGAAVGIIIYYVKPLIESWIYFINRGR